MADFKRAQQTLEFDKIKNMLADCALTEGSKQAALSLEIEDDLFRVRKMQLQTTDAKRLDALKGKPPFGNVRDITARELDDNFSVMTAVIEVNAKLIHTQNQRVVAARTFVQVQPAATPAVGDVVEAFRLGMQQVAGEIIGWTLAAGHGDHPRE